MIKCQVLLGRSTAPYPSILMHSPDQGIEGDNPVAASSSGLEGDNLLLRPLAQSMLAQVAPVFPWSWLLTAPPVIVPVSSQHRPPSQLAEWSY